MKNSSFFDFLFLLIYKHRYKHLGVLSISILIIWLLTSIFLINSSIKKDTFLTLTYQPDFVIQKIIAGKPALIDINNTKLYEKIKSVQAVTPRVYGKYITKNFKHYFNIVGVDFFEDRVNKDIQKLIKNIDIKNFLKQPNMIIGKGVKEFLHKHYYDQYFNFKTSDGTIKKVSIYGVFPKDTEILTNNLIITDIDTARKILNIKPNFASDIAVNITNPAESELIKEKLLSLNFDTLVISKSKLKKEYENFFNYKSGLFFLLFIILFLTFLLILYQRHNMINSVDKKEIAILRSIGWSIKDILILKTLESLIVAIFALIVSFLISYIYVFIFQAPFLRDLFLGFNNLENFTTFTPVFDFSILFSISILFLVGFIFSIIIPVWKISITDPHEALK